MRIERSAIPALALSVVAMCLLPVIAQQLQVAPAGPSGFGGRGGSGGRGGRGPAVQLTPDQKAAYQSKIDELDSIVKALRAANTNIDLIADVEIFAKAGKWLLEFPQDFANAQAVTNYLAVLDQGIERGHQLLNAPHLFGVEIGFNLPAFVSSSKLKAVKLSDREPALRPCSRQSKTEVRT